MMEASVCCTIGTLHYCVASMLCWCYDSEMGSIAAVVMLLCVVPVENLVRGCVPDEAECHSMSMTSYCMDSACVGFTSRYDN